MKKVVIHCGLPRCGSTSLQHFFATNSANLAKQGLLYPNFLGINERAFIATDQGNAYSLCYSLLKDKSITINRQPDFTIGNLREYLQNNSAGDRILLSSEWFTVLDNEAIRNIFNTIISCGYEIGVVCIYRPLADFCVSMYSQRAKYNPSNLTFDQYFQDWKSWFLYAMKGIFGIAEVLSEQGGSIRFLRLSESGGEKLEHRFLSLVMNLQGELPDGIVFKKNLNSSLTNFSVMLQTLLKRKDQPLTDLQINALDRYLVAEIPELPAIKLFTLPVNMQLRVFTEVYHALTDKFGNNFPETLDIPHLFSLSKKLTVNPGCNKEGFSYDTLKMKCIELIEKISPDLIEDTKKKIIISTLEER
jgi:hypothetical protein